LQFAVIDNCIYLETKNLSHDEWFNSVREGKIEIVEKYLKNGWDVNAVRN
jgi:hypothetical protein